MNASTPEPTSQSGQDPGTPSGLSGNRRDNIAPSPKRSAVDFDSDNDNRDAYSRDRPTKKVHRGDSPLKGAAGRRLDQAKQRMMNQRRDDGAGRTGEGSRMGGPTGAAPNPNVIPDAVMFLLGIIPGSQSYNSVSMHVRFRPEAMVGLLREVQLPGQGNQGQGQGQNQGQFGYGR